MYVSRSTLAATCALTSVTVLTTRDSGDELFPRELVDFVPFEGNPVFAGTGKDTWDQKIREQGYKRSAGARWPAVSALYNPFRFACLFSTRGCR